MARKRRNASRDQVRSNKHAAGTPNIPRLDEHDALALLETALDEGEEPLLLILDGVQDPRNLGACLRTADAAGAKYVLSPSNHSVPLTDVAIQTAVGAAENVPFVRVKNLAQTLDKLRQLAVKLVGTSDATDVAVYDVDLTGACGIVMGAEGAGIRRLTADKCDSLVRIPMLGGVPCLNVSVATGVCLFEAVRQRSR